MTLLPHNSDIRCFVACEPDRVNAGLCDCHNRLRNEQLKESLNSNKMTTQQIENTKTIVEFLGGKVEVSYENKTTGHIDYSVRGKVVEEWRAKGLDTKGYKDGMLLDNCKFHSSWDWMFLVFQEMHKKKLYIDHFIGLLDAIIEVNIENAFSRATKIIELYNEQENE